MVENWDVAYLYMVSYLGHRAVAPWFIKVGLTQDPIARLRWYRHLPGFDLIQIVETMALGRSDALVRVRNAETGVKVEFAEDRVLFHKYWQRIGHTETFRPGVEPLIGDLRYRVHPSGRKVKDVTSVYRILTQPRPY